MTALWLVSETASMEQSISVHMITSSLSCALPAILCGLQGHCKYLLLNSLECLIFVYFDLNFKFEHAPWCHTFTHIEHQDLCCTNLCNKKQPLCAVHIAFSPYWRETAMLGCRRKIFHQNPIWLRVLF